MVVVGPIFVHRDDIRSLLVPCTREHTY